MGMSGGFAGAPGWQRDQARAARQGSGPVAQMLWQALRARKFGAKVRRQVPFGPYVVDFCSHEARLVLLLRPDAAGCWQSGSDLALRAYVAALGYRLISVPETDLRADPDGVIARIGAALRTSGTKIEARAGKGPETGPETEPGFETAASASGGGGCPGRVFAASG